MRILLVHPGASWSVSDYWNGYHKALRRLPSHTVFDYALDKRIGAAGGYLNYCWKRNGKTTPKPTPADIVFYASQDVLLRALYNRVDWVLVVSAMYLHPDAIIVMRRAGLKVAVMMTESPYDTEHELKIASLCNVVFTNERTAVPAFEQVCSSVHYLRHAYDAGVHQPHTLPKDIPSHDVVFVGTGFQERCDMLSAANWRDYDLGVYGTWTLLGSRSKLRRYVHNEVVPNETATHLYQNSKIGLNIHRTSVGFGRDAKRIHNAESMNPRALELAGCGVFQLSSWRKEYVELFGCGVPTFITADELQRHLDHYMSEPEERLRWAQQMRTAAGGETFEARVPIIERALEGTD